MRPARVLFCLLASGSTLLATSCASTPAEEPEDPAALVELLDHADPFRREEAAHRLSIAGLTIPENQDSERMKEAVARALEERDPQRMVWRAWHALRAGCLAREANRVQDALTRQGFRLIEIYEPDERTKFVRFVARNSAYVNGAGDRHDLFFWVQSVRKSTSWVVREVYVGLHVKFEAPFKQLAARDRYPRDSVLGRFFELEELQTLAIVFPVLEEIEFTYGRIRLKGADGAPAGFVINAGFVMEGKAGGRGICYTAESGLDPRETRRGRLAWDGFESSDATGPLTSRGGGFWGAGGPRPSGD
jgi:hypothetical protein